MDPFIGEIRLVGFSFAPLGWAFCQGQLMPISQNTALFALLGTFYGGNGTSTFALPNMGGSIAVGMGQGAGLSPYSLGQVGGSATVTLTSQQMPAHTHALPVNSASGGITTPSPTTFLGSAGRSGNHFYGTPADQAASPATMLPTMAAQAGGSQPHNNMGSYLSLNYIIALTGIFPPRS